MSRVLTDKQERFCQEFVIDGDRAAAYLRADYKAKSHKAAYAAASRLMAKAHVLRRIDELREARDADTMLTAELLIQEVAKVAFSSLKQVLVSTDPVKIRPIEEIPDDAWAAIQSLTYRHSKNESEFGVNESTSVSIKMHPKGPAQKLLAEHLGVVSELETAIATFKTYGYAVEKHNDRYVFIDTHAIQDPTPKTASAQGDDSEGD